MKLKLLEMVTVPKRNIFMKSENYTVMVQKFSFLPILQKMHVFWQYLLHFNKLFWNGNFQPFPTTFPPPFIFFGLRRLYKGTC